MSEQARIGIIGLGDMGKLYARTFAAAGHAVLGCDLPEKRESLRQELAPFSIEVAEEGGEVSRRADLIIYSVEAGRLEEAVRSFGPDTRPGAIVAGQTAVKTPEVRAFDRWIPRDIPIVTCHSMHGPSIPPRGQSLMLVRHRASDPQYARARTLFAALGSRIIETKSAEEHDRITADIQAVTHLCFESMGTAWMRRGIHPWNHPSYLSLLDEVKTLMTLRIFAGKSHVYGELALLNPFAVEYVSQYRRSASEILAMVKSGSRERLGQRMRQVRETVFADRAESDLILDSAHLKEACGRLSILPPAGVPAPKPNSHLSILAMADAWNALGVNPLRNSLCRTPPYLLRLGIAEQLFRSPGLLEESLDAAFTDAGIREDDEAFVAAVEEWADLIARKDLDGYQRLFEASRAHFGSHLAQGLSQSDALIGALTD